jgi:hypothetical protein
MILVYERRIKNLSDFDKELLSIPHKSISGSRNTILLSEICSQL